MCSFFIQASRLEEKEVEMRKEYAKLHDRYSEVRNIVKYLQNLVL